VRFNFQVKELTCIRQFVNRRLKLGLGLPGLLVSSRRAMAPLTPARGTLRALSACQLVTVKAALTLTFDAASNWGNWAWADMVYLSKMIEGDGGKSRVRR